MKNWEEIFQKKISEVASVTDPAHDLLHFQRVVKMAKAICEAEGARMDIVVPAAWLHDLVIVPKNDPRRSQASRLSAKAALDFLESIHYPQETYRAIAHAIESHSFSAQIEPETLEAKIVQDADRIDGLGAIGIARCFATAGVLKRSFYEAEDPFCQSREANDQEFTIDHFYVKLFKTAENLKTQYGKEEGLRRAHRMREYLEALQMEI